MENPSKVVAPKSPEANQKAIANHKETAKHLQEAANHHNEAAKHHESGAHEKASASAVKASEHLGHATKLQADDHKMHPTVS